MFLKNKTILSNKTYRFQILYNGHGLRHPTLERKLISGEIVDLFITDFGMESVYYQVTRNGLRYIDSSINISAIKLMDNLKFITIESLSYMIESGSFVRSKYVS